MNIMKWMLLFGLFVVATPVHAEIFSWVDPRGITHYTNKAYEIPPRYRAKVKTLYQDLPKDGPSSGPAQSAPTNSPLPGQNSTNVTSQPAPAVLPQPSPSAPPAAPNPVQPASPPTVVTPASPQPAPPNQQQPTRRGRSPRTSDYE